MTGIDLFQLKSIAQAAIGSWKEKGVENLKLEIIFKNKFPYKRKKKALIWCQ
jgi:hypothetical protein